MLLKARYDFNIFATTIKLNISLHFLKSNITGMNAKLLFPYRILYWKCKSKEQTPVLCIITRD